MNSKFSYTDGLFRPKNKAIWVLSSIIWLIVIIIFTNVEYFLLVAKGSKAGWHIFAIYYLLELVFLCICFFWLFPKLLREVMNRPVLLTYIPLLLTVAPLFSVALRLFIYHLYERSLTFNELKVAFTDSLYRHTHILFFALILFLVRLVITYVIRNRKYKTIVEEYEVENKNLQSSLLGVQINPHLMVNVLNAVQGNILEQSPESSYLLHHLAGIHEHILAKSGAEQAATLADEVDLINKIVTLYESLGKKLGKFELTIRCAIQHIPFPPNLLTSLIENIYKHGDFSDPDFLPEVLLTVDEPYLQLYIRNKIISRPAVQGRRSMGIRNCLDRLKIHFPHRYSLTSVTQDQFYQLTLTIKISNYD